MKNETNFKKTEIGMIPEDWEVRKIEELGEIVTGKTPSTKKPEYFGEGMPFVTPSDFENYNKNVYNAKREISEIGQKEFNNIIINENSVLVTCIGSDMGKVALAKTECITNQQINSIRNINYFNPEFIYYKLKSQYLLLKSLATSGSTMPIINKNHFGKIRVSIPKNPKEQKSIAHILSILDEKIELLQKQNKTLEEIGQAIFKRWFVDFEFPDENGNPYKSSGGKMVWNEELQKEIPEGWSVGKLDDYVDVTKGCSYKSSDLKESSSALVTLKSINRGGGMNQEGYKEYSGDYKKEQVLQDGDIVVAQTDLTQRAEIIGRPALVTYMGNYEKLIASLDLQIIRTKDEFFRGFIYYLLKTNAFHGHALSYTNGTTVLHLGKEAISSFRYVIPNEIILKKFNELTKNILDKKIENIKQIQTLSQTRDSLLPKLMSGKIRVPVEER